MLDETTLRILRCIREYKARYNGLSPSYRDISNEVGGISISTVQRHILRLIAAGIVKQGPRRGLMLTHSLWIDKAHDWYRDGASSEAVDWIALLEHRLR